MPNKNPINAIICFSFYLQLAYKLELFTYICKNKHIIINNTYEKIYQTHRTPHARHDNVMR